jgi:hypothetical protein
MSQMPIWPTTRLVSTLVRAVVQDNLLGYLLVRGIGLRSLEQGELEEWGVRHGALAMVVTRRGR